jgi:hypothetical protein
MNEQEKMTDKVRESLEQKHGMLTHLKRDMLWQLAWEHGHASGYSEVILWYEELVELLK